VECGKGGRRFQTQGGIKSEGMESRGCCVDPDGDGASPSLKKCRTRRGKSELGRVKTKAVRTDKSEGHKGEKQLTEGEKKQKKGHGTQRRAREW